MITSFHILLLTQLLVAFSRPSDISDALPNKATNIKYRLNELLDANINKIADNELLVINLWQTTCGPCIVEIPELNELVTKYGDSNVRFLAFSDEKGFYFDILKKKRKDFRFSYELNWGNIEAVALLKSLDKIHQGQAIPIHIVVRASGVVQEVLLGASPENIEKLDRLIQGNIM